MRRPARGAPRLSASVRTRTTTTARGLKAVTIVAEQSFAAGKKGQPDDKAQGVIARRVPQGGPIS